MPLYVDSQLILYIQESVIGEYQRLLKCAQGILTKWSGHNCTHVNSLSYINTATTHIGSSCACSDGQSRSWSQFGKCIGHSKSSSGQPPQTNHTIVSRYRHCDGEVVIHSTNGHLLLITRLLSLS